MEYFSKISIILTIQVFSSELIMKKKTIPLKLQCWIDARKRFHLSHAHIQMARELGLNPKKFGGLANHKQEPWKEPLPDFISTLYRKKYVKSQPDDIKSIEQIFRLQEEKKRAKKEPMIKCKEAGLEVI